MENNWSFFLIKGGKGNAVDKTLVARRAPKRKIK